MDSWGRPIARPPQRLDSPLSVVLAGQWLKAATKLGLETVEDLLTYCPRRYLPGSDLVDFERLRSGHRTDEEVLLIGEIRSQREVRTGRGKRLLKVTAVDAHDREIEMTFFNFGQWTKKQFAAGSRWLFRGRIRRFRSTLQLDHPKYHPPPASMAGPGSPGVLPIYPERAKVSSWRTMELIHALLDSMPVMPDTLPAEFRQRHGLIGLREAYEAIHRPRSRGQAFEGLRRLKFEEAFLLQTELARRRIAVSGLTATPREPAAPGLAEALDARLPFELTAEQRSIGETLRAELARPHPMQRLLQGEVGSGKTVTALRAMLTVVDAGGQAVLLAPTEVLAQQHFRSITALLGPLGEPDMLGGDENATGVALLTGGQTKSERRQALDAVESGSAGIVIGTHALLGASVQFADLGLVVIDEQHRFGVEQRAALSVRADGVRPHVLVMTATPIPRTVAMTVFGDLERLTLTELPSGRADVTTEVVPLSDPDGAERWSALWARAADQIDAGHQVFVVCPRISEADDVESDDQIAAPEPSDDGDEEEENDREAEQGSRQDGEQKEKRPAAANVSGVAEWLADGRIGGERMTGRRVEVLHGGQPAHVKDTVMRRFAAGQIDVLVSTTVVEVGVDVANAAMMVVLSSDWFGVSQLHQLRGRIGRGAVPGHCALVTRAAGGTPARARIAAVASTRDGFLLAEHDLKQRKAGDILGELQHGRQSTLRFLDVATDEDAIVAAREDAVELVGDDPDLKAHPEVRATIDRLYGSDRIDFLEKT